MCCTAEYDMIHRSDLRASTPLCQLIGETPRFGVDAPTQAQACVCIHQGRRASQRQRRWEGSIQRVAGAAKGGEIREAREEGRCCGEDGSDRSLVRGEFFTCAVSPTERWM